MAEPRRLPACYNAVMGTSVFADARAAAARVAKRIAPRTRLDSFAAVLAAAICLALVPGLAGLLGSGGGQSSEAALVVAIVELLFAFLCMALILLARSNREVGPSDLIFIVSLGALCLFLGFTDEKNAVWSLAFPAAAVFVLGPRRGLRAGIAFGLLTVAVDFAARGADWGFRREPAVVYAVIAFLAWRSAVKSGAAPRDESEPDHAAAAPSADPDRGPREEAGLSALAGAGSDEILVLYRKDALNTLAAVPEPAAVFSYLLLEGLAAGGRSPEDSRGSGAETENQPDEGSGAGAARSFGDYELRGLGIDAFMDRIDSVIDVWAAKKAMEFNKIQGQIDMVLSRDTGEEPTDTHFERLCFEHGLSEREIAVAKCILKGATNKEISTELFISVETVKTHVKNLLKKCDIGSRIDFIKLFSKI